MKESDERIYYHICIAIEYKYSHFQVMCCIDSIIALKRGKNQKEKGYASFDITIITDMIKDRIFLCDNSIWSHLFDQNMPSFNNQNMCSTLTIKGNLQVQTMRPMGSRVMPLY